MPESDQGHPPVITGGVCVRAGVQQCAFVAKSGWGNGEVNGDAVHERGLGWNDVIGNREEES